MVNFQAGDYHMTADSPNDPHATPMDCVCTNRVRKRDHHFDVGEQEGRSCSSSPLASNPMCITALCNPTNVEVIRKEAIPIKEEPPAIISSATRVTSGPASLAMEASITPVPLTLPSETFGSHARVMTSPFTDDVRCGKRCTHCGTSNTPSWRRSPEGCLLCNACGLYEKINSRPRKFRIGADGNLRVRRISALDTSGRRCTNCRTDRTPMWRRLQGVYYCNACAIYYRTNGYHRPVTHGCGSINSTTRT